MDDSSHGSAHPESRLAAARGQCVNRDIFTAWRAGCSPQPFAVACTATASPNVARANAAKRRREWIESAGGKSARGPMWSSRERWLSDLRVWSESASFVADASAARVSLAAPTLVAIAVVMADHADHATGRHVAVTRATVAVAVGCSPDTVTVAWRLLRSAGWAVEAQRGHGSPGTPAVGRRPSVYHLVPRRPAQHVHNPDLPPKAGLGLLTPVGSPSPSAPAARVEEAQASKKRCWRSAPRPLPLQRLAAELVARSHGLDHGHIGAVCDAITAVGIDPEVWPARSITDALNADMRTRGWSWPDRVERPGAFLAYRLRRLQWRPEGPPKGGGVAAAGMDEGRGSVRDEARPLTAAQRGRIAAARAEIRAVLAARKVGRERDRQGDDGRPLRGAFGAPLARSWRSETEFSELGCGEESARADGPVFGGVTAEFGVGLGAQLRCPVAVAGESVQGGGGLGA